jgi:hypothetical protein
LEINVDLTPIKKKGLLRGPFCQNKLELVLD